MRQIKSILFVSVMIITFISVFISCENENDDNEYLSEVDSVELKQFLKARTAKVFFHNFKFEYNNLDIKSMKTLEYAKDVNVFYIPVYKNKREIGRLCVISKNKGEISTALFEDWSKVEKEKCGKMKVFTPDNLYIATWTIKKEGNGEYSFKISDVTDVKNGDTIKTRGEIDFPKPGDYNCTARCYKIAKDVCEDDYNCKYLCDLLDVFFCSATITIAASCQLYCWGV